jgi:hypothetical protein
MSAWLCSDKHINLLATAITNNRIGGWSTAPNTTKSVAQMLLDENIMSLEARYGKGESGRAHEMTGDTPREYLQLKPLAIIKLINCYQYQSCEHAGWKESDACRATEQLKNRYISDLVEAECGDEYWGI